MPHTPGYFYTLRQASHLYAFLSTLPLLVDQTVRVTDPLSIMNATAPVKYTAGPAIHRL